jgi:hypothetical protein
MRVLAVLLLTWSNFASAEAWSLDSVWDPHCITCAELDWTQAPIEPVQRYHLDLEFTEPATKGHVLTLVGLQLLDVATTAYAIRKYDCIVELNPLLPRRPGVGDLVALKLLPLIFVDDWRATDQELAPATFVTAVVVVNNFEVIHTASKQCGRR